jgi:hypothetical protein
VLGYDFIFLSNKNIKLENSLIKKFIRQLVPAKILLDFDIVDIDDSKEEELVISLIEKENRVPKSDKELVLNGYMKEVELTHFPSNGRQCYLRLKRRRWKEKESGKNNYYNQYDFTVSGTKVTKEFGVFLKEINR